MRQRASEAGQRCLGRNDVGSSRGTGVRGPAADVDDGAGTALPYQRQCGLCAVKRTVDADIERGAPCGVRHVGEAFLVPHGGDVDQDVEAAEDFDASGDRDDALMALARGAQWVRRVALPRVPEEFRDSFLHCNASNRQLLAAADRRLPTR